MPENTPPTHFDRTRRVVYLSTYPPTHCGIATFTSSLVAATKLVGGKPRPGAIRVLPEGEACSHDGDSDLIGQVRLDDPHWPEKVLQACRQDDILWIQHEFGIFGPEDGIAVLDLVRQGRVPVAVTAHTVPANPTSRQRRILGDLGQAAVWVVVMSELARARLGASISLDPGRVRLIPHGAIVVPGRPVPKRNRSERPLILNWGLIGPGKGLEWGIRAMPLLRHLNPAPRLLIHGVTHPNVVRREGEAYRKSLQQLIGELGVDDMVDIESGYLSQEELLDLMAAADFVLLPYDSREQVTSGVLVDALGAGVPVVATAFPHAVELLSGGAGTVVPHQDPPAIAHAIEHYLTEPTASRSARQRAEELADDLSWPRVAMQYSNLARQALAREAAGVA